MATQTIQRGDHVRVTGLDRGIPYSTLKDGQTGIVIDIFRADRHMERRAKVLISSAFQPIIALRFLEVVDPT